MREPASKDGKQGEQQKSSSKLNFFPPLPVGPGLLDGLNRKPLYDGPGLSLRPQPPAAPPLPRAPVAFSALPSAPTLMRSPAGALKVNDPGDAFEQEADRVADRVMRMGNPEVAQRPAAANEGLQRKCASCQEEEEESQIGIVQREEMGAMSGLESAAAPPIVHEVLRSPGEPLDASMRSFMEPRFGQSFSHVRVHTDAKAAESARAVDALAYTVGDNIVFDNGQYAPQTESGTRLMAHELAHTIQQGSGGLTVDAPASVQRQTAGDAATSKKPTVHRNVTQKGLLIPWKGTAEASIFSFLADFMPASLAHEITREVLGKSRFVIEGKSVSRATFDKKPGDFLLDDSLSRFLAQRTGLRLDDPGWLRLSQRDRKLLSDFAKARPDLAQSDKIRFDHLTTEVKQRMALQLADTTILGASAKAANDAFTNPRFLTVLVGTALLYYALWKIPHPIAKLAAGALTAYLLTQFTWHDLYGFAKAWDAFYDDCARAKSGDELKKAGNRFLSEAGPRVFDIMLAIVLWRVGRRKVGPKGGGSEAGKAGAEGGTTGAEPGRVEPKRAEPERVTPRSATSETSAASPDAESHPATAEPTGGEQTQAPSPPVAIPRIGEPPVADTSPSAPPKTPAEPEIKPPAEMQDQPRHIEAKTSELEVSQKPKTAEAAPVINDYVNNNPKATADEIRIGKLLDGLAQNGELQGIKRVEGAPEVEQARSGDYRFIDESGTKISADLLQPRSDNPRSIALTIRSSKSGQAKIVVTEFGAGRSGSITDEQISAIVEEVLTTPGHSIERLIIIKDGKILIDQER